MQQDLKDLEYCKQQHSVDTKTKANQKLLLQPANGRANQCCMYCHVEKSIYIYQLHIFQCADSRISFLISIDGDPGR